MRPCTTPKLAKPIVCAEFWANRRGESIRIQLREYEGAVLLDTRRYYTDRQGKLAPTDKGVSVPIKRLPDLARGINKALLTARQLGLIKVAS